MVVTPVDDDHEYLVDLLPKNAHRHIPEILRYFGAPQSIREVEVVDARVELEQVEFGGLEIGLDGYGNAVRVRFPYPAEVTSWRRCRPLR
jgi:hypothetical protein